MVLGCDAAAVDEMGSLSRRDGNRFCSTRSIMSRRRCVSDANWRELSWREVVSRGARSGIAFSAVSSLPCAFESTSATPSAHITVGGLRSTPRTFEVVANIASASAMSSREETAANAMKALARTAAELVLRASAWIRGVISVLSASYPSLSVKAASLSCRSASSCKRASAPSHARWSGGRTAAVSVAALLRRDANVGNRSRMAASEAPSAVARTGLSAGKIASSKAPVSRISVMSKINGRTMAWNAGIPSSANMGGRILYRMILWSKDERRGRSACTTATLR
mmetsp:Transcript_784/g.2846  ORF Transcript_784/g.2846 Transcript_784/m.2846 type:complete len:282 (+) Transcript_784:2205-3050(+)